MATKKKMLQAAAGNATGGAGPDVEDVFSTYLYTGTGSNITVTHNIDLSTEGGLVWVRPRISSDHWLWDSARGTQYSLATNNTAVQTDMSTNGTVFNTDGFTDRMQWGSGTDVASWTFRKAPKFFDVVYSWTGDGTSSQTISHNLGSVPGAIFVKCTSTTDNWRVYHRSMGNTDMMALDSTGAAFSSINHWNNTSPTATEFTVGANANVSGREYVAYLFAHNDGDGEFGPDGDADIIKCGSYTGNGSSTGPEIDLGFEPQWLLIKSSTASESWYIINTMSSSGLRPNASSAETTAFSLNAGSYIGVTSTGFNLTGWTDASLNGSGQTYIYIAIRRGTKVPESADDVFSVDLWSGTAGTKITTGFPVDMQVNPRRDGSNHVVVDRVRGVHSTAATGGGFPTLFTNLYNAEVTTANTTRYWDNTGYQEPSYGNNSSNSYVSYSWSRAPNYFDALAFSGTGSVRTVSHNLGVAPEMMWIKRRNTVRDWSVYHSALGATKYIILNDSGTPTTVSSWWNDTEPTSSDFTTGGSVGVNGLNDSYIAYLFASLDGISKVGSYTGTGAAGNQIDCGFSSGARFVLIKRSNSTGDWFVFDTERGIVTGNDSRLVLNSSTAEGTNLDLIDPYASGFELGTSSNAVNGSGDTYIFYAIA